MIILQPFDTFTFTFSYQQDTYVLLSIKPNLRPAPISLIEKGPLFLITSSKLEHSSAQRRTKREDCLHLALRTLLYRKNTFDTPIPAFPALFAEHVIAPSIFQVFCVALWCLDEYWYYSLFTLFTLVTFGCTVMWQRVRTLTELCSRLIKPCTIQCYRDGK